jgi:hypothetical protein
MGCWFDGCVMTNRKVDCDIYGYIVNYWFGGKFKLNEAV